jgi:hypothetical protein
VKTDRFPSASMRAAAVLLAGLLLAADGFAAGQRFHVGSLTAAPADSSKAPEPRSKKLAKALASRVAGVQQSFAASRGALRSVLNANGESAYPPKEVAGLIAHTEEDLDQAIAGIAEPGLEALRAWAHAKLQRVQEQLTPFFVQAAASPPEPFTARAVAVVASLGRIPLPELASVNAAAPKPRAANRKPSTKAPQAAVPKQAPPPPAPRPVTVPAATADRLLDQVGEVVKKIFLLASQDDLTVTLWVGSTPEHKAAFSFWPEGKLQGTEPQRAILRTNGTRTVLRGLFAYEADWVRGGVKQVLAYPSPAGTSPASTESEELDLVNGSSFFCCRFKEGYCHHVASEAECHS